MRLRNLPTTAPNKSAPPKKGQQIGELEELVARSILFLGNNSYALEIRDALEDRAKRSLTYGTIYATLDRLLDKKFVTVHLGEPSPEAGGRAKRYFKVTADGISALQNADDARMSLTPTTGLTI